MAELYKVRQKILLDGKSLLPFPTDIIYPESTNFYKVEIVIPASTSDYVVDLSDKGTIKRFSIESRDGTLTDIIKAKVDNASKLFAVNPVFSGSYHITSLKLTNNNTKDVAVEVVILSE